ncbi:MAG: CDF family Co(II)/Ni(II) efflux transporter DmeF, partial [Patescibacteria group bacterium]
AVALSVNAFAYIYARRHAHDRRYSFGTGKINTLGGFSGAVLLAVFALLMAWESFGRLIQPVQIIFDQAILVALLGLLVNGISVFILGDEASDDDDHTHAYHPDHNLKSAYLHVMADALTSVLAIIALLAAKYLGFIWMDPAMGIVGALLVARWSYGLLQSTSLILLDRQGPETLSRRIKESIEGDQDSKVADLHLWSIGPNIYAVVVTVVAREPATPDEYRARMPKHLGLAHISLEIHQCSTSNTEHQSGLATPAT